MTYSAVIKDRRGKVIHKLHKAEDWFVARIVMEAIQIHDDIAVLVRKDPEPVALEADDGHG